jgi:phospholipid/cholesterol/gamma-HCH transport system substrate-binding protein
MEALKHSFFFRGFFKDRGFYDLGSLSPVEYQSKQFEKNVTKERAWIQKEELFIVKPNGSEELSDPGRKKLDGMMANFLRFTKDRAVIVEGYAAAGTVDEQFLLSRERATTVREYLISGRTRCRYAAVLHRRTPAASATPAATKGSTRATSDIMAVV